MSCVAATVGGCSFNSTGIGEANGMVAATASETSTGSSPTETEGDGTPSSNTDPSIGAASLEVDTVDHDFGELSLGDSSGRQFTLTNVGDVLASDLGATVDEPFAFGIGGFPGEAGTCELTLGPGESCTFSVAYTPNTLGPQAGGITVVFNDGQNPRSLQIELRGSGAGSTGELLENGDAEQLADEPPGWTIVDGFWETTNAQVPPNSGTGVFFAGADPAGGAAQWELRQVVSLADFATVIDQDLARGVFSAAARSLDTGNDQYRIVLDFLDASAEVVRSSDSEWTSALNWETYGEDDTLIPSGVRSVLVRLFCRKATGTECNAYFDDISLRIAYP